MSFNGTEGAPIALTTASQWTANYRATIAPGEIIARYMGKDAIEKILSQEGCMGIRIYYAIEDDGVKNLVFVGADANENDMLDMVYNFTLPCPNRCSDANPLNS